MTIVDATIFELAPVAMWIEDFSGVKQQFDQWRAEGVTDLRAFLTQDLTRVAACSSRIRVLKVNDKTLELFEADNLEHLVDNLSVVFRDEMLQNHINELSELWDGKTEFCSNAVNYSLSGKRMDIQLKGTVLPGHEATLDRILLTTEDVTAREDARRNEISSRLHAEGLFKHSPVSLWVEDFSAIHGLIEDVRYRGIVDFRVFMDVHPEFVRQCMSEIRIIDVNQATLDLFCAPDVQTLLQRQVEIFRDEMEKPFREQLMDLWEGKLFHHREVVNYALDGTVRHILLHFAVLPGHEEDWSRVQVALTDITARKKAEAYLEYLGKHDVLTKLHNRAFYKDELNRLERKSLRPVSAIIMDLNGLKEANDQLGHDAGDALLRRFGEVLGGVVTRPYHAARIGGDEFAILMPGADQKAAAAMVDTISELLHINNQFYSNAPLSVAIGIATSREGESMESVVKRADFAMYEDKRAHHNGAISDKTSLIGAASAKSVSAA
ncbi:MAG: sensor domain-containing diguanylate cyclase [Hoeflea sp.]|uniref:sensor domain-containing diguanylate cyclase n=1 Tax=Hoeflea sp. TaxID=1940281 RepID=UPI001DC3D9F7|nr:sensor domain-containing diguanylate cyclase [Hoeflea sp.]MBU4527694.1 sensor domain-containing diguanylate cyclase [Alphaproteobacteria bacterium]MBU4546438.1 sensor domain-containing diguanylate cyclase [Alphaproteobacteria bacterium]MBU4553044.1 sensor domain-containing diguanylate cyclase [Alphaproteobacteria bacterium]MBV1724116.1 sensor domain-containing diguanylate cyclase [Hoeflea sp.]MBV1759801.1 sensor domain-containing diguanylate cyclase [Hoeflea sp.]